MYKNYLPDFGRVSGYEFTELVPQLMFGFAVFGYKAFLIDDASQVNSGLIQPPNRTQVLDVVFRVFRAQLKHPKYQYNN